MPQFAHNWSANSSCLRITQRLRTRGPRQRNKAGAATVKLVAVSEGVQLNPKTEFRQLYDQEFASVYRSIRAVVLDSAAGEDLTQETFVRAYRARHRYTPTAPPGAWLRRIGINLAISHLRRQKLARYLPARLDVAPDRLDFDRAVARDVVTIALTDLSPQLRAAVNLLLIDGLYRVHNALRPG